MFRTNADGCGFFLLSDLIRNKIRTTKSSSNIKSFRTKKRAELLLKKSKR